MIKLVFLFYQTKSNHNKSHSTHIIILVKNIFDSILRKQRSSVAYSDNTEVTKSYCVIRKDKLENLEIRDLLICVVYIFKNISQGKKKKKRKG